MLPPKHWRICSPKSYLIDLSYIIALKLDSHATSALADVFEEIFYTAKLPHAKLHINKRRKLYAEPRTVQKNSSVIDIQLYLRSSDRRRT